MKFHSPSSGSLNFEETFNEIVDYMQAFPEDQYKLIVGTDSQVKDDTWFVTAVIIHHVGKGARYFYVKRRQRPMESLRQRMLYEASLSLTMAGLMAERLSRNGHADLNVEIHLDVGRQGETKELIRELVGMITGSGFNAKIKPESYGASKVADKHTK